MHLLPSSYPLPTLQSPQHSSKTSNTASYFTYEIPPLFDVCTCYVCNQHSEAPVCTPDSSVQDKTMVGFFNLKGKTCKTKALSLATTGQAFPLDVAEHRLPLSAL